MNRDFTAGRVELRDNGGPSMGLSGLAAVFYDGTETTEYQPVAGLRERILAGAFDEALSRGDDVRALWNHDPAALLGRTSAGTLRLSLERRGLRYDIPALGSTSVARDVREWVARGEVDGSSFAFVVEDEDHHKEGDDWVREIRSVRLHDVGPVTYPAYTATTSEARAMNIAALNRWASRRERLAQLAAQRNYLRTRARLF